MSRYLSKFLSNVMYIVVFVFVQGHSVPRAVEPGHWGLGVCLSILGSRDLLAEDAAPSLQTYASQISFFKVFLSAIAGENLC